MAEAHRFQGKERLARIFREMPPAARAELRKSLALSAKQLVRAQKALVPVDTGKLRGSIDWTADPALVPKYAAFSGGGKRAQAGDIAAVVFAGGPGVRYAHLVEFGTVNAEAQPFFYPAWRLRKKQIAARARRAARTAARNVRRQAGGAR
jgi:HK97 gp10 family phage protein